MSIRRMFNNAVSIVFTFIKFSIMKLFLGSGFHFKPICRFSPNVVTEFERGSHVTIGNRGLQAQGAQGRDAYPFRRRGLYL